MIARMLFYSFLIGSGFAADQSKSEAKSGYWKFFSAPSSPVSIAQFTVDPKDLAITSTGEARAVFEHCLLLGCEVVKINGVTFYLPSSIQFEEPFKAPVSTMIDLKQTQELPAHIRTHTGKVCFIWTGRHAEFADVLSMAAVLSSQNVPFYFGIRDELANKIKLSFF